MVSVLAVNGSPRQNGNTAQMLGAVLAVCAKAGFSTERYQAGGREVRGCKACGACAQKPGRCVTDDWVNNDMVVPGSSYWNMSLARGIGEYAKDEEGLATMARLGENIVWLAEKLGK